MATASIPPTTEARDVFRELGYTVSEGGQEFVAERKWRRVLVTVLCMENDDIGRYLADGGDTRASAVSSRGATGREIFGTASSPRNHRTTGR